MTHLLAVILLVLTCAPFSKRCNADMYLSTMPYVWHTTRQQSDGEPWNSRPLGVGLHYTGSVFEADVGSFKNSYGRQTFAVGTSLRALHTTYVDAGVFAALATGYAHPVIGGVYVQVQYRDVAVRLLAVPPAAKNGATALALQLRVQIP